MAEGQDIVSRILEHGPVLKAGQELFKHKNPKIDFSLTPERKQEHVQTVLKTIGSLLETLLNKLFG